MANQTKASAAAAADSPVGSAQSGLGLRNTARTWGYLARTFHWVLAMLILGMIAYGYWMNNYAPRVDRFFYRSVHADIGYLVLFLTALRLVWRAFNPAPAMPAGFSVWLRIVAQANHWALYVATFVVTLLGWAHAGAHKPDYSSWFGLFRVPQFTAQDPEVANVYEQLHTTMAYVLLALIGLHVLGALYHHFVLRDRIVMRMIDGRPG